MNRAQAKAAARRRVEEAVARFLRTGGEVTRCAPREAAGMMDAQANRERRLDASGRPITSMGPIFRDSNQ